MEVGSDIEETIAMIDAVFFVLDAFGDESKGVLW